MKSSVTSAVRQQGLGMVEVVVSLTIFAVLILAVSVTLVRGMEHRRQTFEDYGAMCAARGILAEIQDTANMTQDLSAQQGIGAVFAKYNGQTFPCASLPTGQITVTCHASEVSLSSVFGGAQDLNLDGDAQDVLGGLDAGTDLKLIPVTVVVSYFGDRGTRTLTVNRLITRTTD
jgi:Tfp pilus assembly protein PilV